MTESSNGLRFDIYERVQLPGEALAIETLEEIELSPHIEALEQEDSVLLRGHLLLSGTYQAAGQGEAAGTLEHRIPVEISLPYSRVRQLEELDVEIDHFDVDLLSDRSLNVTGVLSLRGVQTEAREAPVWREDGFTVVHEAPERISAPEAEGSGEGQAFTLPPLGESAFEEAAEAGFADRSASGDADQADTTAYGIPPQTSAYSQPGPVYLPPAYSAANPAQDAAASTVWYEQQRARAEAEARAREEALLRRQELAQAAAEALERQLAQAAQAEAEQEARQRELAERSRAEQEARDALVQAERSRAEQEARDALAQAERNRAEQEAREALAQSEFSRQQEEERDRREEAEAWASLLAYQRLEEESPKAVQVQPEPVNSAPVQPEPVQSAPVQSAPAQQTPAQAGHSEYPQVYDTAIPVPTAWPGNEAGASPQGQSDAAMPEEAPQAGHAHAEHQRPGPNGPKLGLSGKESGGLGSDFGVGILSQLGDKGAIREAGLRAAEEAKLAAPAESKQDNRTTGDEIEWTRLFLAKEAGQSFRKVKMVIVQREDTLDQIAGRYQLQSRELQLYNRLSDPHLAEGQVLYIP